LPVVPVTCHGVACHALAGHLVPLLSTSGAEGEPDGLVRIGIDHVNRC